MKYLKKKNFFIIEIKNSYSNLSFKYLKLIIF